MADAGVSRHLARLAHTHCGTEPLLHHIFENSAIAYPTNIAVECDEDGIVWTYGELNARANELSILIRACGVGPDDLVGVFLPRGGQFYVCMLAILKAGGAYVSIDPEYPAERVRSTIEDSHAKLVLTLPELLSVITDMGGEAPAADVADISGLHAWSAALPKGTPCALTLEKANELIASSSDWTLPCLKPAVGPSHACYAIFTSGSTGRPKGVCIEHQSAVNFVLGEQRAFPTNHYDRVLQGFSTSFDASVEEIWLAFASGAALVVGTKETMRAGPALGTVLASKGITVFSTVPTVLRVVEDIPAPPLLRIVITGGEACPPEVVSKWCALGRQFLNTYGPTEATVVATYTELQPDVPVTIGKPLPGYSAHIVDDHGQPCTDPRKPGELLVGGRSVARGYINRPDLNPEKFIPDGHPHPQPNWVFLAQAASCVSDNAPTPVSIERAGGEKERERERDGKLTRMVITQMARSRSDRSDTSVPSMTTLVSSARGEEESMSVSEGASSEAGGRPMRLYRTGDLVQWNDKGEIEFLGRIDSQVKIRGFRVELSEIESAIARMEGVGNVCVVARTDIGKNGSKTLIAYIEPKPGTAQDALTPDRLKAHAASILPDYMVPCRYVTVATIPLSPSGKVDRKAIEKFPPPGPETAPCGNAHEGEYLAPEGPLEAFLAETWQDLLDAPRVGATDDFFKLGGNSLSAAQLISALRKKIPMVPTAVRDLYDTKTLRNLGVRIQEECRLNHVPLDCLDEEGAGKTHTTRQLGTAAVSQWTRWAVWTIQLIVLTIMGGSAAAWTGVGIYMTSMLLEDYTLSYLLVTFPMFAFGSFAMYLVTAAFLKWLILGNLQEGEHPLWGWFYLRWWIAHTIGMPAGIFASTPIAPVVLRLFGSKVGRNVHIASTLVSGYDLLEIEDDVVVNVGARVSCVEVEDGKLKLSRVHLGRGSVLGMRSCVKHGASMEDGATLGDLAVLMPGQTVPAHHRFEGAPAAVAVVDAEGGHPEITHPANSDSHTNLAEHKQVGVLVQLAFTVGFLLASYGLSVVLMAPITFGIWVTITYGFVISIIFAPAFVIAGLTALFTFTVILKWLTVGRIREGSYPLYGWFYLRWLMNYTIQQITTVVCHQFYSTMFTRSYFNMLGAKLGRRVEISDAREWTPDMLDIGDDCFVADFVGLGGWRVGHDRHMTLKKVVLKERTFLGNNACVPGGSHFGESVLLGVMSLAPPPALSSTPHTSWLGSPPFRLPNRAIVKTDADRLTFHPPLYLYPIRASIELLRTFLPPLVSTYAFLLAWWVFQDVLYAYLGMPSIALAPAVFLIYGGINAIVAVQGKYLLVGRYKEDTNAPLWSPFVWRAELSTALEEDLAYASFIRMLSGTPFMSMWFRLLGAKIGHRVYLATPHLTEPDLIEIGDDCCINADVTVQGHLFEDRIMKMGRIKIDRHCTVGTRAVVLYHTHMHEGSYLVGSSLMMKGEEFGSHSRFGGIPAKPLLELPPRQILTKTCSHPASRASNLDRGDTPHTNGSRVNYDDTQSSMRHSEKQNPLPMFFPAREDSFFSSPIRAVSPMSDHGKGRRCCGLFV